MVENMIANGSQYNKFFLSSLPKMVRDLIDLIGMEETKSMLKSYGGKRKYVPQNKGQLPESWGVLTFESFLKICSAYSGDTIEIPKIDSFERAERNREIVYLAQRGMSRRELGQRYGLTYRQIGNIRRHYERNYAGSNTARINAEENASQDAYSG